MGTGGIYMQLLSVNNLLRTYRENIANAARV